MHMCSRGVGSVHRRGMHAEVHIVFGKLHDCAAPQKRCLTTSMLFGSILLSIVKCTPLRLHLCSSPSSGGRSTSSSGMRADGRGVGKMWFRLAC